MRGGSKGKSKKKGGERKESLTNTTSLSESRDSLKEEKERKKGAKQKKEKKKMRRTRVKLKKSADPEGTMDALSELSES